MFSFLMLLSWLSLAVLPLQNPGEPTGSLGTLSRVGKPDVCYHQPAGLTEIFSQPWSTLPPARGEDEAVWKVRSKFERERRFDVVGDPTAPASPPHVIRGLFPAGAKGGSAPFRITRRFDRGYSRLYMCIFTRLDPRFTNNGNVGTKFGFFLTPYSSGPQRLNHYMNLTPRFGVNLQSDKGYLNRNMHSRFNFLNAGGGVWHKIEVLIRANTNGIPNGIAQVWVDDRLVLSEYNVKFFYPGQDPLFTGVTWNPTYGGGHNPVPYDMYQWIDHWYASGG